MNKSQLTKIYALANKYESIKRCLPLQKGAIDQIDIGVDRKTLEKFMAFHCNRLRYLGRFARNTRRFDLHGNRTKDAITADEKRFAAHKLQIKYNESTDKPVARKQTVGRIKPLTVEVNRAPVVHYKKRRRVVSQFVEVAG